MKSRTLSEKEKQRLMDQIRDVLGNREDIRFAYLFGSFVTENVFHDIDLAIYLEAADREKTFLVEVHLENVLEDRLGYPIDIRIINAAPLPFRFHVLKDGIALVDKTPDMRSEFERLTWKAYVDYRHIRDEYLRGMVHATV